MKQKPHSGVKKRFKLSGGKHPKVIGRKAAARHRLTSKNKRQKRQQQGAFLMSAPSAKTIRKLM